MNSARISYTLSILETLLTDVSPVVGIFSDERGVVGILRTPQSLVSGTEHGVASLEGRVVNLEMQMRNLAERLDGERGSGLIEPAIGTRPQFHGDTAFQSPVNQFHENLAHVKQQLGLETQPNGTSTPSTSPASTKPPQRPRQSTVSLSREQSFSDREILIGSRKLPFPSSAQYRSYLDFFFEDIKSVSRL